MEVVSPDINIFLLHVLYDLSGAVPFVVVTNESEGPNLGACSVIFELRSSSGIAYHSGTWDSPDVAGDFYQWNCPEPILQVLSHIEWSGADFTLRAHIRDTQDRVFTLPLSTSICRPFGNKVDQKNNFGTARVDIRVKCEMGRVYVQDNTNYAYKGLSGVLEQKTLTLIYPRDTTGTQPTPFTMTNFNAALLPIWYSAKNYQLVAEAVMLYHFDNNTSVRIKYKFNQHFNVLCNVDLCPLVCEVNRLVKSLTEEGCSGDDLQKLTLINAKLNVALIAKTQPLCGLDLARLVDEIKELGGFKCDCYPGDGVNQLSTLPYEGYAPNDGGAIPIDLTGIIS
jgi:hypothetical protein